MSILKPPQSVGVGLAVAGLVVALHMTASPSIADVRVNDAGDPNLDRVERLASWKAAGIVSIVSLLTKDPTVFVIGGMTVIGMAAAYRYSNVFDPVTGRASTVSAVPRHADDMVPAAA